MRVSVCCSGGLWLWRALTPHNLNLFGKLRDCSTTSFSQRDIEAEQRATFASTRAIPSVRVCVCVAEMRRKYAQTHCYKYDSPLSC